MQRAKLKLVLLLIFGFNINLEASIDDYVFPYKEIPSISNYGTSGLIQTPTARFFESGSIAFSFSAIDPYYRGSIMAYPFSWLEASYQYTDINNALYSNVPAFSGKQTYKDKSFDIKFLLFKETMLIPSIAVGARDIAGTGAFSAEYIVASKQIKNFDISLGMGWGSMSDDRFSNPMSILSDRFDSRDKKVDTVGGEVNVDYLFSGDVGIFGGIDFFLPNFQGIRFRAEYDSTNYKKEGFPYGRESFEFAFKPVKQPVSKINYGIYYPISRNASIKLNFAKGNTISIGFSLHASLGKKDPLIKKRDSYKGIRNSDIVKKLNTTRLVELQDKDFVYKSALKYMADHKLYLQNAKIEDDKFSLVYQQSIHSSWIRSTGRTARVLNEILPDNIKTFEIANINAGMGTHSIIVDRESFDKNLDKGYFPLVIREMELNNLNYDPKNYEFNPKVSYPVSFTKFTPSIRSQIGGPDGFYFGDLRLAFHAETLFRKDLSLVTILSTGIVNNFDELKLPSDSVLPHVRTDIVQYLKQSNELSIRRLQLNYFKKFKGDYFSKISFGLMEEMFGGIGAEFLYRPFYKNYGIGVELWRVQQRDYDMRFNFRDYKTTTGHLNLYFREPNTNILFQVKGGRFLAGDSGFNFDFSRVFKSGLRLGAFFSLTDISKYEFGEGSFDKGFYFFIPIEVFFQNYSKGNTGFGLRPITRDGAAALVHSHPLWGVTDQSQYFGLFEDLDDIYD